SLDRPGIEMTVRPKLAPEQQLTIEEFLAFTDSRPEGERWELIEGVAVLNPSPVDHHQVIVADIVTCLMVHKRRTYAGSRHARSHLPQQPPATRRVREGASHDRLARVRRRAGAF